MSTQYGVCARPRAQLYVHDIKGFLWAVFLSIVIIDVPLALGQNRFPAISAACLTILVAVPVFLYLYTRYGGARKSTQLSITAPSDEALELCLASLGELDDSEVTELDEQSGKVRAICRFGKTEHNVSFKVVPIVGDRSHIYISSKPADPWACIDTLGKNRKIVEQLNFYLQGFVEWSYTHDSNVSYHHICKRAKTSTSKPLLLWLLLAGLLIILCLPIALTYVATQPGIIAFTLGTPTDLATLLRKADANVKRSATYLARDLINRGDLKERIGNVRLAENDYLYATRVASGTDLYSTALDRSASHFAQDSKALKIRPQH